MADIRQTLDRALGLHRQGRMREAETLYRQVLLHVPLHADALNLLGVLLAQTQRPAEADRLLHQAVDQQPDNPDFRANLGHSRRLAGDLDAAEACYQTALEFDRAHEDSALTLGALQEQRGDLPGAERVYRGLLEHRPQSPMVLFNLSSVLNRLGRLDEAEAALEQAVGYAPRFVQALGNLAAIRLRRGKLEAALATYRQALAVDPRLPALHVGLGNTLYRLRDFAGAVAAFQAALARDDKAGDAHAGLINALLAAGRIDEAIVAGQRAATLPDAPARLYCDLAAALERRGRAEEALQALAGALARNPHEVRAYARIAPLLFKTGRDDEAARLFDFRRLLYWHQVDDVPGYADPAAFNRELAAYIRARPDHTADAPAAATRGGSQTAELFTDPAPVVQSLKSLFEAAARAYLARHRGQADHPYFAEPPARWHLISNAVILHSSGYQDPHVHPAGYLSGVYYVDIPEEVSEGTAAAGCIRFYDSQNVEGVNSFETLRPKNGLLVLFPSYFWHGTVPFASMRERICVAMDLVPEGAAERSRAASLG